MQDLTTHFETALGVVRAVDGVSFTLDRGRSLGIVGESGSGKTILSRSIMGLLPKRNVIREGSVRFEGQELTTMTLGERRAIWGAEMAMIFQDPMTSLNPVMKIGKQVAETLRIHLDMSRAEATATTVRLLEDVGIPEPEKRLDQYPHELSGGMRQRIMIAMALACGPALLFADEPTTALDVTVQAQILDLIQAQRTDRNMSVILVTHDLGVVAGHTDEIIVMYAGQVVEQAPTPVLFREMRMPYTEALLESIPKLEDPSHTRLRAIPGRPPDLIHPPQGCRFSPRCPYVQDRCREEAPPLAEAETPGHEYACWYPVGSPVWREAKARAAERGGGLMAGTGTAHLNPAGDALLRVENLNVEFPVGRTGLKVYAVSGISLDVLPGETLGLVGESGCGKSTTGRAIMQLPRPTSGSIRFEDQELTTLHHDEMRTVRTNIQMIFQDPISSLNPRRKVGDIVLEPLTIWKIGSPADRTAKVRQVLEDVGIDPDVAADRRPHQFSGGQCQRISIARALVLEPKLIICDEPVSALDVSVQAQVLNLLEDLKQRYGLTLMFIAHDLAVVKNVSDRVGVMYLGKLCEVAPSDKLYSRPAHPYTDILLQSIPVPDPSVRPDARSRIEGEIPSPVFPPSGCRFRTRCPRAQERCAAEEPVVRAIEPGHFVACHFPLVGEVAPPQSAAA